jgi:hypothetical protein
MFNIKISNKRNTNTEQFPNFEECFDCEHQQIKQKQLLQKEINYQQSIIKPRLKKILKECSPFTLDLCETFPEYHNKYFIPIRNKINNEFLFFKYFRDDGKGDDEESEDNESKDLLLKEIKQMFENGYFHKDFAKMFHHSTQQTSKN